MTDLFGKIHVAMEMVCMTPFADFRGHRFDRFSREIGDRFSLSIFHQIIVVTK